MSLQEQNPKAKISNLRVCSNPVNPVNPAEIFAAAGFRQICKKSWIPDLPETEPKSGGSLLCKEL